MIIRKIHSIPHKISNNKVKTTGLQGRQDMSMVELYDQQANDYILKKLEENSPIMISKFGTTEMSYLVSYHCLQKLDKYRCYKNYIKGGFGSFEYPSDLSLLCKNSGFFPNDIKLLAGFYDEYYKSIQQIDVLGSYIREELCFSKELVNSKKVNLDGYYAPFFWKNPWTKYLKGKTVLVIHPFAEEINLQYNNHRHEIWQDPDVLPAFSLKTYKAVQSILGIETEYSSWFEALNKMKSDISQIEFDVAIIGCGAYGMPLAAYCKELGKQAIHLAGWTQVLFGIIGTRWENNPKVNSMINKSWIRPLKSSTPHNAKEVENACYW